MWIMKLNKQSEWLYVCHSWLNVAQTFISALLTCTGLADEETAASLYVLLYKQLVGDTTWP